jgi:MFS family permease
MKDYSAGPIAPGARLHEWKLGWAIVLSSSLGIAVYTTFLHFVGTLMGPLQDAYGWSRGEISLGLTLITTLSPPMGIIVGALADRYGARPIALVGSIGFGITFAAWGLAGPALWSWYFFAFLFATLGHMATPVVWTLMIVKYFNVQRGLALAIALSGSGLAIGFTPTLALLFNDWFGLRGTFMAWGLLGGLLMLLPAWYFFREKPQVTAAPAAASKQPVAVPGHTFGEALRDRNFWQFTVSVLLVSLAVGTLIVHLQPMLIDSGLDAVTAASVALFVGPAMIAGRIIMGMLFDVMNARVVSGIAFLLPACGCAMLGTLDGNYAMAALAGIVIGFGLGAEMDVLAYVVSRYFGMRSYGKIFALLSGLYGMGIGAGSAVSGALFDATGSYRIALLLWIAASIAAAMAVATLGKPRARESGLAPVAAH